MCDVTPEVDEDVNDEHDVHDEVDHVERRTRVNAALSGRLFLRRRDRERPSEFKGRDSNGISETSKTSEPSERLQVEHL